MWAFFTALVEAMKFWAPATAQKPTAPSPSGVSAAEREAEEEEVRKFGPKQP